MVLSGYTVRPPVSYIGENLGDSLSEPTGVRLATETAASNVVVRALGGVIGAAPCSGSRKVVLFHHDWPDEEGVWHQRKTTIPGVQDPIALCEHVVRMSFFAQVPCPRGADNSPAPGCACVSSWRAAREPIIKSALSSSITNLADRTSSTMEQSISWTAPPNSALQLSKPSLRSGFRS
jgi:hypothetical protein